MTDLKKYVEELASSLTFDENEYKGFIDGYMRALCDNKGCEELLKGFYRRFFSSTTPDDTLQTLIDKFKKEISHDRTR